LSPLPDGELAFGNGRLTVSHSIGEKQQTGSSETDASQGTQSKRRVGRLHLCLWRNFIRKINLIFKASRTRGIFAKAGIP
jgi:hypothetical protein